jgi:hypothetical protein
VSEFEVEPGVLRAAALEIQPLAGQVGAVGAEVSAAAAGATGVNNGYVTSLAAQTFAGEFASALSTLAESVARHGGGLANCAVTYAHTETRTRWMMDRVRRSLPTV